MSILFQGLRYWGKRSEQLNRAIEQPINRMFWDIFAHSFGLERSR